MQKTLVLIKPDAVERRLIGDIIRRYESKNLSIEDIRFFSQDRKTLLQTHYEEHKDKSFFNELIDFMNSGSLIAMILSGDNSIDLVRKINGKTHFLDAEMGSIRGDFANNLTMNLVHGSDSLESAKREISIWFE